MYSKNSADVAYIKGEFETAAKMYYEGARDGDPLAAFNYGYCLLTGRGVVFDPVEAKSFFGYARELEGGAAYYNLAVMYLDGIGVKKDYRKAIRYMSDAAEMGCIEAQLYLGMAYTLGYILYPDIIRISMIPCHTPEMRDINSPLLYGEVVDAEADEEMRFSVISADARRAFEYFRSAAYHDYTYVEELVAKGQFLYAKCFLEGMGTDFDRNKGLAIMMIAGKSGSTDALEYIESNGITEKMLLQAASDMRGRKKH